MKIIYNPISNKMDFVGESGGEGGGGEGSTTFLGLTDTPSSYSGKGGNIVVVKGSEDGLDIIPPTESESSFSIFLGNRGQATNYIGYTYLSSDNTTNQADGATTGRGSVGINNGQLVPIGGDTGYTINEIEVIASAAATSVGTVGTPSVRIEFFTVGNSSGTPFPVPYVDVPVLNSSAVGIYNNLGGTGTLVLSKISGISVVVPDDSLWGINFINISGEDGISALGRFYITLRGVKS